MKGERGCTEAHTGYLPRILSGLIPLTSILFLILG